MATKIINGVESKKCTNCGIWKPCNDFPKDATHDFKQCFTHCKCKKCRNK